MFLNFPTDDRNVVHQLFGMRLKKAPSKPSTQSSTFENGTTGKEFLFLLLLIDVIFTVYAILCLFILLFRRWYGQLGDFENEDEEDDLEGGRPYQRGAGGAPRFEQQLQLAGRHHIALRLDDVGDDEGDDEGEEEEEDEGFGEGDLDLGVEELERNDRGDEGDEDDENWQNQPPAQPLHPMHQELILNPNLRPGMPHFQPMLFPWMQPPPENARPEEIFV